MDTKITAGPWKAQRKEPEAKGGTHYITCPIGVLGYWRGHKRDHEDSHWVLNDADAHLIAAAPELLDALREFVPETSSHTLTETERIQKARAAVVKATGAQP